MKLYYTNDTNLQREPSSNYQLEVYRLDPGEVIVAESEINMLLQHNEQLTQKIKELLERRSAWTKSALDELDRLRSEVQRLTPTAYERTYAFGCKASDNNHAECPAA